MPIALRRWVNEYVIDGSALFRQILGCCRIQTTHEEGSAMKSMLASPRTAIGMPIFATRSPADQMTTLECAACHVQLYMSIEKLRLSSCRCPGCGAVLNA